MAGIYVLQTGAACLKRSWTPQRFKNTKLLISVISQLFIQKILTFARFLKRLWSAYEKSKNCLFY